MRLLSAGLSKQLYKPEQQCIQLAMIRSFEINMQKRVVVKKKSGTPKASAFEPWPKAVALLARKKDIVPLMLTVPKFARLNAPGR
jgi:hypothetical protein